MIEVGKKYLTSTKQELQVKSVKGESVILVYLNRKQDDVNTTVTHVERVLKLEVWKEV